jgi:hypothetical protein
MLCLISELPSNLWHNEADRGEVLLENCKEVMMGLELAAGKFWVDSVSFSLILIC